MRLARFDTVFVTPRHGWRAARIALAVVMSLGLISAPASADDPALGLGAPQLKDTHCTFNTFSQCKRMRFAYGPITVKPGANMQLLENNVQKPNFDGYVTRLTANLYRTDGTIPPVDVVHLHHGAWVSIPTYGNNGVFYASGEEKTEFQLPDGYGMKVMASDTWLLAHMLHNLTPVAEHVYMVWDLDYVPAEQAEAQGIKPAKPIWLNVQENDHPLYPVFNVQRGFGHFDPKFKRRVCTFPKERCAAFDPYGFSQPGNGHGYDWMVSDEFAGTLIGLGGHLHPGGLEDQVSVVRNGTEKRIFNSDAKYFDKAGPVSWDMAMTVTPPDWRVQIRPGDKLRLNAVYDAQRASWYENMGIVMAWVSPGDFSGTDVFAPGATVQTEGDVTHGHLAENDNHGGKNSHPLPRKLGRVTNRIGIH